MVYVSRASLKGRLPCNQIQVPPPPPPLSNSISPVWNRKHESDQNPQ